MEIETIKNNSGVKWEMVKLGDYVERIKTWNPTIESPNDYFFYIDLSSVDKDEKIINPKLVLKLLGKDAPSRARQILKKNDVLVSTVRPNLNGVAILNQDYEKATASTGYCILRTKQDLNPLFLYYWVRNEDFVNDMILKSSGASYPAVSDKIIKDSLIPLPPLPVQKRIAEILDAADALRRKDQELLKKYDELAQAIFIDMFGDPVKNEKGWEVKKLNDLLLKGEKISYGVVQPGDDFPNGIPIVRVGDFNLMKISKTNLKRINPEIEKTYSRTRLKGDEILIACVGSVGKIALADESLKGFNIVRATAKVRVDENIINRKYLAFHLSQKSIQNYFIAETRTSSQPTLNIKQIEETKILVPPIKIQNQFNLISDDLLKQIEMIYYSNSDSLFQTLLQKAFKGELVAE